MKNLCLLHFVCQVLKLLLIKIFNIHSPASLFLTYCFTLSFLMDSLKVIMYFRIPTRTSIITTPCIFKIELSQKYFKRSLMLPFYCSGTTKSNITQAQAKLSTSMKVRIPSTSVSKFTMIVVFDVAGCFLMPQPPV